MTNEPLWGRSIRWYAKRVSVMNPAEIGHRVAEQWAVRVLRMTQAMRRVQGCQPRYQAAQFEFCAATAPELPPLPWAFQPRPDEVEDLLAGKSPALGYGWVWGRDASCWHKAPDTGATWPRTFLGSIPHREENPYGDIRVVWEPSRLQHLVALGLLSQTAAPDVSARATAALEAQLLSWVEANPFLNGVHYLSVMECGLRILAVCHAVDLARGGLRDSERVWPAVVELVDRHALLIEKRLSLYSSTGNHTIAECSGLVYAGTLFPELEGAGRWRDLGMSILEREASRQILPDGGGLEQSLGYLALILDLYGLVEMLLRHKRRFVPHVMRYAHTRGVDFLATFAEAPDRLPSIGDSDGGSALSPFLRLSWPMRRDERVQPLTTFSDAGYSIIRTGKPDDGMLVFDHGPLGMAPSYGHGHADALSVILLCGDREVFLDPGTYTYTGDPRWRAYFRSTPAHNTVTVDGRDQARQETAFMWSRPFSSTLLRSEKTSDGGIRLLARHDGYRRVGVGVEHWRAVLYQRPGSWLIWDYLTGEGIHELALHWHLGVEPIESAGTFILPGLARAASFSVTGGDVTLHRGETDPICGWRSSRYGVKEPITTLRAHFQGSLPHEFVTRIQIGEGPVPAPEDSDVAALRESVQEIFSRTRSSEPTTLF
jgi:hypothetical protein